MTFSVEADDDEGTATTFKLFGSSIAFFSHSQDCQLFFDKGRSSREDVAASMAGSCSESPFCVLDGGKVSKEGVEDEEEESPKGATICININGNREEPEKLLLPCPRCKSLDTKFCYFNNYSVKQPRHFCKKCQRYWTAGGTQRNVSVGSGRRKSKHYSSSASYPHPHHFLNPTDSLSVTSDALDSAQHSLVSPTSVMTTCFEMGCSSLSAFGTPKPTFIPSNQKEAPFCQVLPANGRIEQHVAGQECNNGSCETYASNELQRPSPPPLIDELACSSSVGAQSFSLKESQASKQPTKGEPFASAGLRGRSHFSFLMGPWPNGYGLFELNNNGAAISPADLFSPWCDSGHSMIAAPAMASASSSCGADNPVLGKHPREGLPTTVVNDGCLSTPKTVRIRDVEEAAQSSIWSSLGLDNNMPK